jgi:hypothetical protein
MPTYLIRRTRPEDRNANGIAAALASGTDEAAARALAASAAPTGTKIPASWQAVQVGSGNLPDGYNPVFFEGAAVVSDPTNPATRDRFRGQ